MQHAARPYPLLFLAIMVMALGQTLVFALLPLLGRAVGLRELQVGAIITASSAVYAAAARFWGRRSDTLGRRRVMIIGLSGYTGGTLVFASLFGVGMAGWLHGAVLWACLIIARCLQSTVMAGTMPAANAYICDITTAQTRTAGIAKLGAANSTGTIIGPALGGLLATLSLLAPLYVAAAFTLISALLLVWKLPESPRHHSAQAPTLPLAFTDPRYRNILLIGVLMLVALSVVQQTLAFYFQDTLKLNSQQVAGKVGLALMLSAVVALLAQALLVQRLKWPPFRLIFWGLLALMAGSAVLGIAGSITPLFLGVALCGLGMGLSYPGCLAAASLTVSAEEQGALAGLTSAVPALGSIVGPVLGTGLYEIGHGLPYFSNVLLLLPMLALCHWQQKRQTFEAPLKAEQA